jgi:hypothetical protein
VVAGRPGERLELQPRPGPDGDRADRGRLRRHGGGVLDRARRLEGQEQFIGDYTDVAAGPSTAYVVWTDVRAAALCAAVSAYRAQVYAGSKTAVAPNPNTACPAGFGDTDTELGIVLQ